MRNCKFYSLLVSTCVLILIQIGCVSVQEKPAPIIAAPPISSGEVVYSSYVQHEPLVEQIFWQDLGTGETKQLTNADYNGSPRWSPDGTKILFLKWTEENSFDIFLMDKNGDNQHAIVATEASERFAEWSPNGEQIIFTSNDDGEDQIYTVDLDTLIITRLTNSSNSASMATWSPSGKYVAFTSSAGGTGRSQIFMMNADGSEIKQLTEYDVKNYDGMPIWCPDETCIIFTRWADGGVRKLMALDLKNGEIILFLGNVFEPDQFENQPSLLVNSEVLAFSVEDIYYAMKMESGEIFPLGIDATSLAYYP